jgi:hypothetical protein
MMKATMAKAKAQTAEVQAATTPTIANKMKTNPRIAALAKQPVTTVKLQTVAKPFPHQN